jgi:hypothetical protein
MTRQHLIEQISREIYGGFATDDANIDYNLINQYIEEGIAVAAKQNYKENIQIEGIGFVNNSFYTTFKGLAVTKDENFIWKFTLPQIPLGIGRNEGIETIKFKDSTGMISYPGVPLSSNQATFFSGMRPIPNKILVKPEGGVVYAMSTLLLNMYTATVTMISGGNSTDLGSILNVPTDYFPIIIDYCVKQLMIEKQVPQDVSNDGLDKA